MDLSVGTVTLEREGDYVRWGPGIVHSWQAEDDSAVITVWIVQEGSPARDCGLGAAVKQRGMLALRAG